MRILALLLFAVFAAGSASSATIVTDTASTTAGDTNGIVGTGFTSVGVGHPDYTMDPTNVASEWVWDEESGGMGTGPRSVRGWSWTFTYDDTAPDRVAGTGRLTGQWAVDNGGVIFLNGAPVSVLGSGGLGGTSTTNFTQLHSFSSSLGTIVDGINTINILADNYDDPAGLRASFEVIADATAPAVPLPATAPLLLGAIGAAGAFARRRKAA